MEQMQNPARALALQILNRTDSAGQYTNLALDAALKKSALSAPDKALVTVLVYGVTERRITLDYIADALSSRPIETLDGTVRNLVRMGLYQLCYLDRVPAHAAINETVSLSPRRARGFVNAVLREYTRRGADVAFPEKERDLYRYLSVNYSVPVPLCKKLTEIFGAERAESVLEAFGHTPPITLRVNTLKTTPDALSGELCALGYRVQATETLESALTALDFIPSGSPQIEDGHCFVQDLASQICVEALGALPGETVIDVCACPGSKTFGTAIRMQNAGRILAYDLHQSKLSLIEKGASRLGISIIEARERDARDHDPALCELADRVLCDVPCSGFGVLGKKPEIRYKALSDAAALPDIQFAILQNCSRYVKKGGVLVYSTCTVFPEENEQNVSRFLAAHPEFVTEDFSVGTVASTDGMLTLTPDLHGTDGFFIAKLRKVD